MLTTKQVRAIMREPGISSDSIFTIKGKEPFVRHVKCDCNLTHPADIAMLAKLKKLAGVKNVKVTGKIAKFRNSHILVKCKMA